MFIFFFYNKIFSGYYFSFYVYIGKYKLILDLYTVEAKL